MADFLLYLAIAGCLATLAVLVFGIGGFGLGKMGPRTTNRIMRLRILAQFLAICFILLAVMAAQSGS